MTEEILWVLAFLVKLHRGDVVRDAANAADKAADEFNDRWCDEDE